MKHLAGVISLLALLACTSCRARSPSTDFTEGVVEAGGVALHVSCIGEGAPTVVFDAGLGNDGTIWRDVQLAVGRMTRACVYDRAGLGRSGPAPKRHTSQKMVSELHAVLRKANIRGPLVLVGHSLGGLNMRLFASEYGAAGLVLVDAVTENQDSRFWSLLPPELLAQFRAMLDEIPEGVDFDTFRESLAQVRASRQSFGVVPVVVLTRGKADPMPDVDPEVAAQVARAWTEMQADLRRLAPNAIQVVAPNSGHFIQTDAPQLVIEAIREVLDAAGTRRRLDATRLAPFAGGP